MNVRLMDPIWKGHFTILMWILFRATRQTIGPCSSSINRKLRGH